MFCLSFVKKVITRFVNIYKRATVEQVADEKVNVLIRIYTHEAYKSFCRLMEFISIYFRYVIHYSHRSVIHFANYFFNTFPFEFLKQETNVYERISLIREICSRLNPLQCWRLKFSLCNDSLKLAARFYQSANVRVKQWNVSVSRILPRIAKIQTSPRALTKFLSRSSPSRCWRLKSSLWNDPLKFALRSTAPSFGKINSAIMAARLARALHARFVGNEFSKNSFGPGPAFARWESEN